MSRAYYNEIEPYAAAWLRNLIAAGLIAPGDVDERSIADVSPDDLAGYDQCHFFAGIGGWSRALRLAEWPDDKPAWTGSCPCQPLSVAGQHKAHADERHLWPAFYSLIAERRPATVFGEQVASKDGREWFAGVRADLEALGYACGAADLCAASVGAPHIRQRLFFVADANGEGLEIRPRIGRNADQKCTAAERSGASAGDIPDAEGDRRAPEGERAAPGYADGLRELRSPAETHWLSESGILRVADGVSARMGKLRALGNAIVPQVAAVFVSAYMETAALVPQTGCVSDRTASDTDPSPEYNASLDSALSFEVAIKAIGEQVKQGIPLPPEGYFGGKHD